MISAGSSLWESQEAGSGIAVKRYPEKRGNRPVILFSKAAELRSVAHICQGTSFLRPASVHEKEKGEK